MATLPQPTIGWVRSTDTDGEFNDDSLTDLLQSVVAGLTGLDGTLVIPTRQRNPPNDPDFEVTWASIGVSKKSRWTYAFEGHYPSTVGGQPSTSRVIREEDVWALAGFYGPEGDAMAEQFSMGFQVSTNRQAMQQIGLYWIESLDAVPMLDLRNNQNRTKYDVEFRVRRRQSYTYAVNEFIATAVVITIDDPVQSFTVTIQQPTQ